ncbi:PSD1 and planctomycete cytochrome C domain-containing protein [Blastopirellula sp. J2-11]|uniref:PSD1 and planctomycete cytochrome C domain-containing protein n=1 Tax=Blastopirellula sp. J2-11 TaxID=2943192 RepID=UPI0021C88107|nr:PSD1 and planctomycete cytochrome C domain-containing protein [Blastopirellula sp. J2-11]UUO04399.1 PSD1 and planctomycete cytochrome C domain-containing protein [Blastopirellula sp. J2-11]
MPRIVSNPSCALMLPVLVWIVAAAIVAYPTGLAAETPNGSQNQANDHFESKIRPLLVENCYECHGPKTQWGGLRFDARQFAIAGGDSGAAIVPGKSAESLLVERISSSDELEKMPPQSSGKNLSQAQIDLLRQWIDSGAAWPESDHPQLDESAKRDHWAFQPISSPSPPEVKNATWPQNNIDRFILHKLEATALAPSPPTDRRTFIRRATFDLTGLPPSPEEVEAFVADQRPDAYERLIDRLLNSPAYGEQWARHWLDVARYSDTKGYVYGREERFFVHSVHYRDWVIQAFNSDMPYDQFVRLQLAADQVAPDDPQAAAAMGFVTLGRRFLGVEPDIIDDRIDVVTRGLLGLTVGCARCHDHKFDPIPTADYYSLYGIFQNSAEKTVPIFDQSANEKVQAELKNRKTKLHTGLQATRLEFANLTRSRVGDYLQAQFELEKYPQQAFSQILSKKDLLPTTVWGWQRYLRNAEKTQHPVFVIWTALAKLPDENFLDQADIALTHLRDSSNAINPLVAKAFATTPATRTEMIARYAELFHKISRKWDEQLAAAATQGNPPPKAMDDSAEEELRKVLYAAGSPCVIPDLDFINIEFDFDTNSCVEMWKLQSAYDQWILANAETIPHAVQLVDKPTIATPRVLRRGNANNPGDEVPMRFLKILSREDRRPFEQGSGRLELAEAIAAADNPLTARVWVNRVWMHHFDHGIVRTPSDFGTRADPPTHPDLLDWLARNFIDGGWSTKDLHRQIMLSAAYQQKSTGPASPAAYAQASQQDPENRLLWRMNRRRLTFEQFRDASLKVAKDLNRRPGGKGDPLFAVSKDGARRTIYSLIERESLPTILQTFDFANPDLHTPQRSETTVPQQALFGLNHSFQADRARSLAALIREQSAKTTAESVDSLFRQILQRSPSPSEQTAALQFVQAANHQEADDTLATAEAWKYGYGEIEPVTGMLLNFTPLPYFTGDAWQGATSWPDTQHGWAQITADGGHPGNDLRHAIVRRWTAPADGTYAVKSTVKHEEPIADGIRCWILTSSGKVLRKELVHNTTRTMDVPSVELKQGESIDFVVDILEVLNSDQHLWAPQINMLSQNGVASSDLPLPRWNAQHDFTGQRNRQLDAWEQLAQVLLLSNEFLFVD